MRAAHAQNMYDAGWKDVLHSLNQEKVWCDIQAQKNTGLVGKVQVYSDKAVTALNANAIKVPPVQVVFLIFSKRYHPILTGRGHILLALIHFLTSEV